MLNKEQQKRVIDALSARVGKKGRGFICPMCGDNHFTLLDSYIRNDAQADFDSVTLGGPSIPAAAIICDNCGFMSQHALGALGLMPPKKESEGKSADKKG